MRVQTPAGRAAADEVFAIAVARGDWLPTQRAQFDAVHSRMMIWWWIGFYGAKPWWETHG